METHPPWPDLPPPLLDQILDRLPLPDYIRFSAVCPKWRSIQIDHRRRRSPNLLLSYPWLLLLSDLEKNDQHNNENKDDDDDREEETVISCYSPFEQRFYHLNLPIHSPFFCASTTSHGWILFQQLQRNDDNNFFDPSDFLIPGATSRKRRKRMWRSMWGNHPPPPLPPPPTYTMSFYLLNPISKLHISPPPIQVSFPSGCYAAVLDSPRCVALVMIGVKIFLFHDGDPEWIVLPVPKGASIVDAVSCEGKFYCDCSDASLFVVDPSRPTPLIEYFEMDKIQVPMKSSLAALLESDGELLRVDAFVNSEQDFGPITGFRVFKADLSNKMWERMECLGDQMLLLGQYSAVSLAADGVGGRRNCIYYSEGLIGNLLPSQLADWSAWKVFDLGYERITDWPFPDTLSEGACFKIKKYAWSWIVPRLCSV